MIERPGSICTSSILWKYLEEIDFDLQRPEHVAETMDLEKKY